MWRSFLAADDAAAAAASAEEEEVRSGPVAMGPDPACSAHGAGGAGGWAGPARVWSLGARDGIFELEGWRRRQRGRLEECGGRWLG